MAYGRASSTARPGHCVGTGEIVSGDWWCGVKNQSHAPGQYYGLNPINRMFCDALAHARSAQRQLEAVTIAPLPPPEFGHRPLASNASVEMIAQTTPYRARYTPNHIDDRLLAHRSALSGRYSPLEAAENRLSE